MGNKMTYTKEDIQAKAKEFMHLMEHGDSRIAICLMMLAMATGVSADECVKKIQSFAEGE